MPKKRFSAIINPLCNYFGFIYCALDILTYFVSTSCEEGSSCYFVESKIDILFCSIFDGNKFGNVSMTM